MSPLSEHSRGPGASRGLAASFGSGPALEADRAGLDRQDLVDRQDGGSRRGAGPLEGDRAGLLGRQQVTSPGDRAGLDRQDLVVRQMLDGQDQEKSLLMDKVQTAFFNCLDLHHTSPDSGARQDKKGPEKDDLFRWRQVALYLSR